MKVTEHWVPSTVSCKTLVSLLCVQDALLEWLGCGAGLRTPILDIQKADSCGPGLSTCWIPPGDLTSPSTQLSGGANKY